MRAEDASAKDPLKWGGTTSSTPLVPNRDWHFFVPPAKLPFPIQVVVAIRLGRPRGSHDLQLAFVH